MQTPGAESNRFRASRLSQVEKRTGFAPFRRLMPGAQGGQPSKPKSQFARVMDKVLLVIEVVCALIVAWIAVQYIYTVYFDTAPHRATPAMLPGATNPTRTATKTPTATPTRFVELLPPITGGPGDDWGTGTVARGQLREDTYFYTGKIGTNPGDYMPFQVTEKDLARGRERFNIYCAPCHSRMGDGNGMIAQRGFKQPPSYHIERLRKAPLGYIFDVMTNGFGAMPDYASQIPPDDRWRIVAYIRALQLSQNATKADVPAGADFDAKPPRFKEPGSGATLPVPDTKTVEESETAGPRK